jgi:hypothetical protein
MGEPVKPQISRVSYLDTGEWIFSFGEPRAGQNVNRNDIGDRSP